MPDSFFKDMGLGTWCVGAFMLSATFGIVAGLALIPVYHWYEYRRRAILAQMWARFRTAMHESKTRTGESS